MGLYNLIFTSVLVELPTSIFRVEEQAMQEQWLVVQGMETQGLGLRNIALLCSVTIHTCIPNCQVSQLSCLVHSVH
jgi:hypothetical protein